MVKRRKDIVDSDEDDAIETPEPSEDEQSRKKTKVSRCSLISPSRCLAPAA